MQSWPGAKAALVSPTKLPASFAPLGAQLQPADDQTLEGELNFSPAQRTSGPSKAPAEGTPETKEQVNTAERLLAEERAQLAQSKHEVEELARQLNHQKTRATTAITTADQRVTQVQQQAEARLLEAQRLHTQNMEQQQAIAEERTQRLLQEERVRAALDAKKEQDAAA